MGDNLVVGGHDVLSISRGERTTWIPKHLVVVFLVGDNGLLAKETQEALIELSGLGELRGAEWTVDVRVVLKGGLCVEAIAETTLWAW